MVYEETEILGAGVCSYGTAPCGFGEPATITWTNKQDLVIDSGPNINEIGNVPYLNPQTGDYEYNDNNYIKGQDEVQQMVYLALVTKINSSSMPQLGNSYSNIQKITNNTVNFIKQNIANALSHLTSTNKIRINEVRVIRNEQVKTKIKIVVQWTNLTTGKEEENIV